MEPIDEPIVIGSDPWFVYQANHLESTRFGPDGLDGLSAITIVEEGETLKISHHEFLGDLP